ncbi:MAG: hypothetical protein R3B38_02410 [Patescibacteria group bacterium]
MNLMVLGYLVDGLKPGFTVCWLQEKLKAFLRVMVVLIGLTLPFGVAGSLISSGNLQFVQFSSNDDSTALLVYGSVNKNWSFDKAVEWQWFRYRNTYLLSLKL